MPMSFRICAITCGPQGGEAPLSPAAPARPGPAGPRRPPRYLRVFRSALGRRHLGRLHRFRSRRGASGRVTGGGEAGGRGDGGREGGGGAVATETRPGADGRGQWRRAGAGAEAEAGGGLVGLGSGCRSPASRSRSKPAPGGRGTSGACGVLSRCVGPAAAGRRGTGLPSAPAPARRGGHLRFIPKNCVSVVQKFVLVKILVEAKRGGGDDIGLASPGTSGRTGGAAGPQLHRGGRGRGRPSGARRDTFQGQRDSLGFSPPPGWSFTRGARLDVNAASSPVLARPVPGACG